MIVIVDYGMGNLGSIQNMLEYIGVDSIISSNPSVISQAAKLILPGVGAFDKAMENLEKRDLLHVLNSRVMEDKVPVLGVCLGMQLLTKGSEEGRRPGLGWIDALTVRFKFDNTSNLKIPHMGWNFAEFKEGEYFNSNQKRKYYFVHSYHIVCEDETDIFAVTTYGYRFASAIKRGNILGVQFHPEKSHRYGVELYRHFAFEGNHAPVKGNSMFAVK